MSEFSNFIRSLIVIICIVITSGCGRDVAETTDEVKRTTPVANSPSLALKPAILPADLRNAHQQRDENPGRYADVDESWQPDGQDGGSQRRQLAGRKFVNALRVWRDQDLKYSTTAELLEISTDDRTVTLLKANGVAISVPIDRLSEHDRNFLNHIVSSRPR